MNPGSLFVIFISIIFIVLRVLPKYREPIVVPNVLNEKECEHIKKVSNKELRASTVSMDSNLDKSVRNSETAWIQKGTDPVVDKVIEKCIKMTDKNVENCESLQILKYKPGGFYKPHQDAFKNEKNQRVYTFIIALNDEYEGGETKFPNLNKTYKLQKGDALFFHTLNNYNKMTEKALHGGNPVKSGEKWICNLWIHEHKYIPG
jgi:prolyl 4-hydroxylase